MSLCQTRRIFFATTTSAIISSGVPAWAMETSASLPEETIQAAQGALKTLEARHGGRLGVVALETDSGRRISYRANERFAMCSTHKFLTVAAILALCDRGKLRLDQTVAYSQADILSYAPITKAHLQAGAMTVGALCVAALEWSDNTAANLLLKLIGGPAGWTHFARSIGDQMSRLDHNEPSLNAAIPGDPSDTTTPASMVHDIAAILLGHVLTDQSRLMLQNWMLNNQITNTLLRAGMPKGWRVADKSGSGDHGTRNDIGLILPLPPRSPIIAAVYYTDSPEPAPKRDALIAETGRIIARTFA